MRTESQAAGKFPFLGIFAIDDHPSGSSLGFFYVPGRGHFAQVWRETYGPFADADAAIEKLYQLCSPYGETYPSWRTIRRMFAFTLAGSMAMLLVVFVIAWISFLALGPKGGL